MDKYAKLVEVLRRATKTDTMPLINAVVQSVAGDTCTVLWGELELTDVRLKATIGGGTDSLLIVPKAGSNVLLGSLTGDLKDLAVLRVDEMESLSYQQGGLTVEIDSTDGKLKAANGSTSLKDIFQELADLLKSFALSTPAGPTSGILPPTAQAITQFETDFKTLLK